jgi:hypothetical protein
MRGILTFADSTPESGGGFEYVPKFHTTWKEYCKINPIDEEVAQQP